MRLKIEENKKLKRRHKRRPQSLGGLVSEIRLDSTNVDSVEDIGTLFIRDSSIGMNLSDEEGTCSALVWRARTFLQDEERVANLAVADAAAD